MFSETGRKPTNSRYVKLSLVPIFMGIFLNSMYDIKFSPIGTFWALAGVLTTAVYQILVHQKQKELGLDSMQLLSYQAPVSSCKSSCWIHHKSEFQICCYKTLSPISALDFFTLKLLFSDFGNLFTRYGESLCRGWSIYNWIQFWNFWSGHALYCGCLFRNCYNYSFSKLKG